MERERVLNVPNVITTMRICLVGAFIASHFGLPKMRALSAGCFAAAGFTDFLDGMAARKLGQVTWLGKILDPAADRVMTLAALLSLVTEDILPVWVMAVSIIREAYMVVGAGVLLRRHVIIAAELPGKMATLLFVPAMLLAYPWHRVFLLRRAGLCMLYVSLALSVYAVIYYTCVAVKKSRIGKTD